jgi:branched-chain amino acid transport system permease protein
MWPEIPAEAPYLASTRERVVCGNAQFLGILTVDPFYLDLSFIKIAMLVVGGMFSLTGAVTGVVVVTAIVELLRLLERGVPAGGTSFALPQGSQEIGLGIVMALILIFRPTGLSKGREFAPIPAKPAEVTSPPEILPLAEEPERATR